MQYYEVKITCHPGDTEKITEALTAAGYPTFEVEDDTQMAKDILSSKKTYEWDYYDESLIEDHDAHIKLFFDNDDAAEEKIVEIGEIVNAVDLGEDREALVENRLADDSEWKDEWKQYFKPSHITDDIVIKPSWETYEAAPGEKVIEIDPGMAFGTGTHATTRMCIELIEKYLKPEDTFIDAGCGSGILSIAAGLCGCRDIYGFDIDPDAVQVASENVARNGMSDFVKISEGDVTKGVDARADVIAANLMAEIIISICGSIPAALKNGGVFISSGIITEKKEAVTEALKQAGFDLLEIREDEGWCAIAARAGAPA